MERMASRDELETYIQRIAQSDRAAHAALYDCTSAKLFAVSMRILADVSDAEDAMHDSYVKVWTHAGRYRATGHSPMTWLITIARNTAIDRLRTRRRLRDGADPDAVDLLADPGPTPEETTAARQVGERLSRCLDELPADRRRAIAGAYLEGQSYADLAEAAAVPLNTMRTWLRRSLLRLRDCLDR